MTNLSRPRFLNSLERTLGQADFDEMIRPDKQFELHTILLVRLRCHALMYIIAFSVDVTLVILTMLTSFLSSR